MINPYAAGAKVYNAGSSAATSGTVDPMGYINRGLGTGKSQTRSGLAQTALSRLRNATSGATYTLPGTIRPQPIAIPGQPNQEHPINPAPQAPATGISVGAGGDAPSQPVAIPQDPAPAPQAPPPLVGISPAGQVTLNLPFDYDLADQRAGGLNDYNTLLDRISNAMQGLETNNYAQGRQIDYAQQDDQRGDLNRFAARGLARSSGYGQEVADSTRDFGNQRNDLLAQLTQGRNELETERNSGAQSFNDLLISLARQQAERSAAKAGDLHLNDTPTDPTKPVTPTPNTGTGVTPKPTTPKPSAPPSGAIGAIKPKLPPAPKPKAKPKPKPKPKAKPPIGSIKKFG